MLTHFELTRPDGTPLAEDEIPAAGTLLVLELEDVTTALAHLPYTAAISARVIGWVPRTHDGPNPLARTLLTGACQVVNKSAEYKAEDS